MTGTSQATAFVTGGAALVMASKENYYKAEEIKKYILATGDAQSQLASKTRTSRQLNLYKALTILDKGLSLTGVAAPNSENITVTNDPNETPVGTSTKEAAAMSKFSRSLINAVGGGTKPKTEKIGTKQQDL
ncbi:hypothetical protein D3C87_1570750 [compost metagenome]